MSKKKTGGCGNCGSGCDEDKCDGNCEDEDYVDGKGNCTGGCGKTKDNCQCKKMKLMWICASCNTRHLSKPKKCVNCEGEEFECSKYLPSS